MRSLARRLPERIKVPLRGLEATWARISPGDPKAVWARSKPDVALTCGVGLTGDAFIAKAVEYGAGGAVLEVGPGYGRLLEAATRTGMSFDRWIGVDISESNVAHMREHFPEHEFVLADAETYEAPPVNTILSSLTFKHMAPSFEAVLSNLVRSLDGVVVIDLIEGEGLRRVQSDGSFLRWYTRDEVREIFGRCGLTAEFDEVEHDPDHRRLLAVGRTRA